jgi:two-component system cell cycle sensor histidine kinase/response regulator CckA
MWFFSKKAAAKLDLEAVLHQTHKLFVLADEALVAVHGREQLEQFLQSQGLQPTADIERFVVAVGLTPEEVKAYKHAIKNRQSYSTIFTLKTEVRMLLELHPLSNNDAQWALMMRPFLLPLLAKPKVKEAAAKNDDTQEERGWRVYLEHAPIPTVILSQDGLVQRANGSFEALLTNAHKGKTNWRFLDCVANVSKEAVAGCFVQVMQGKLPTGSLEIKLANNEECTLSMFLSRLEGLDSEGFILHMIDLTEQKNLEMRFAHSQKMQAVGQLAGGIAHDFNNLLTAMIGFSDLLLMRHPAGDQSFADIMQIKQNANRAANLVRQLLAFSRKQTLKAELVSITDTLADLANLIRRLIGENIAFKLQHGRDIWPVKVDQGQLEQVVINLAVNARDAMNGAGSLTIRTENVLIDDAHPLPPENIFPLEEDAIAPGEYVRIEVEDTGLGISPELRRKIFEPFFSTKEVGAGTGLGLSTVYGIVKQTGGYICVSSEVGKGTCFTIFLRHYIATAEEQAAQPEPQVENEQQSAPLDLTGGGTVLLVEDEAPVRIFSARALRNKGYKVLEADCADAAFKVVAENKGKLDLIISDVVMPGMTGPAMVEQISQQYPEIRVIFISGYAEDAFMETYGSNRNFHFLPKPFSLKQLATKVKSVLE